MTSDHRAHEFADAADLFRRGLQAFLPPDRIGTAEWAARDRWLNNQGGGFVGRWQHSEAPYLVGPMNALDSPDYLEVAVVGPGRCGKTAIGENWLGKSVIADPAPMLWYEPTEAVLKSYVKTTIDPLIDMHEGIKSRQGLRPVDDSVGFKRFRGMTVEFLPVVYDNLINKSAARIVLDEIDAYRESLGDVFGLADIRRQTFGRASKILIVSHPDRAGGMDDRKWTAGIMRLYGGSTRAIWYWPCPHCNGWSSPNQAAARVMTLEYPEDAPLDEVEAAAALLCPICGSLVEDKHRRAMNQAGVWIGAGQAIDEDGNVTGELIRRRTAGFWVVGAMSNFIIGGVGGLARSYEEARRGAEAAGEEGMQTLKDVVVKRFGVPFDPPRKVGALDGAAIAERSRDDLALKVVPDGVRFLTAFVDVQGNRFELLVRGWGERGESWVIDVDRFTADPSSSAEDWDALFDRMLGLAYPLADGTPREMSIRAWGYDTQGMPGVTAQAYDAWVRWHGRRKLRMLGRFSGRESWSAAPTRGLGGANAPRLVVVRPDSARKDRQAKAGGAVPVAQFNANMFKDDLAGQLARALPGPWHINFPAALRSDAHAGFFDQLTAEERNGKGVWQKTAPRNEALDLMVGAHVVAHLNGLGRIDWQRPPAWAAPWDRNSQISALRAPPPSGGGDTPPAPPTPKAPTSTSRAAVIRRLA
jgi:phage terminase large subunit GpA-like protein